jgi:hypothetical protein
MRDRLDRGQRGGDLPGLDFRQHPGRNMRSARQFGAGQAKAAAHPADFPSQALFDRAADLTRRIRPRGERFGLGFSVFLPGHARF